MNEYEFFYNLKQNNLKHLIFENEFDNEFDNHLNCFYNTIEFDKYYTNLVIHMNKNNLYDIHNNNIVYYKNILQIWIKYLTLKNLDIFINLLNNDFLEFIFLSDIYVDLINKLVEIIDIKLIIFNKNINKLFLNYIDILYKNKNLDIENKVLLVYLELFNNISMENKQNYIYWYYSDNNKYIKDEPMINNDLEKPYYKSDDYNIFCYKLYWLLFKILVHNLFNSFRFICKYHNNCYSLIEENLILIKQNLDNIISNTNFIKFINFTNDLIISNELKYIPYFLVYESIFINIYGNKINKFSFFYTNKLINKLFHYDNLNNYIMIDLINLIYINYDIDNPFYKKNKNKLINLFNQLYNIDKCNNITLDENPNMILINILNNIDITYDNSKLYYILFTNIYNDIEFYYNIYIDKNKNIKNENKLDLLFNDNTSNLNYVLNLLIFTKNNFVNINYIFNNIIYKKIVNLLYNIIRKTKENEDICLNIDKYLKKIYKLNSYTKHKYIYNNLFRIFINILYHICDNKLMYIEFYFLNKNENILIFLENYNYYNINFYDIYFNTFELYYNSFKIIKNIPDNLLDPLTCELIDEPYFMPINNTLIDKDTIITFLLNREEDPFNKVKLTIEELHNYNNKKEILILRNDIKIKINNLR